MVEGKTGAGAQSERASHPAADAPHTSLTSHTSRPPPRLAARRRVLSRPLCLWQCPSLAEFLLAFLPALRLPERLESSSLASRKALALSTPKKPSRFAPAACSSPIPKQHRGWLSGRSGEDNDNLQG